MALSSWLRSCARLVELLTELHARFSNERGLVTLRYPTRAYASERR